jgi:surface-anchored protein
MKTTVQLLTSLLVLSTAPRISAQCFHFTQEHVDLLGVIWNGASQELSLMASDDTHGQLYASNQCVVVCPESMKFTLPGGTPLGDEGATLWILPQNPYAGVPYVGASAEEVPAGVFNGPFTLQLTRLEGPGHFILWQAGAFGNFDIQMDTRDGIDTNDHLSLPVGGHAHYNWGFTTSGVYRAYFQASGVRVGQSTTTLSPSTPFTFQVLPLRPFENWIATNWPCVCATNIIAAGADPDVDGMANVLEYAFGNDPKEALHTNAPMLSFVNQGGTNYGALTYTWNTNATDLIMRPVASSTLGSTSTWETLTNAAVSASNSPGTRRVTIRDHIPVNANPVRLYQLQIRLQEF